MSFSVKVCSKSAIKIEAARQALEACGYREFAIVGEECESGVPDQPCGEETLQGARNRAAVMRQRYPNDVVISIENGLFPREDGHFDDKAAVVILFSESDSFEGYSDSVVFKKGYVEEALRRGITAGKVMAEQGIVKNHADPHQDLSGKPRAEYLREAVQGVLNKRIVPAVRPSSPRL